MDINDLRTLVTVLSFVVFAAIVTWACSSRQQKRFEEAANLPFVEPDEPLPASTQSKDPPDGGRA